MSKKKTKIKSQLAEVKAASDKALANSNLTELAVMEGVAKKAGKDAAMKLKKAMVKKKLEKKMKGY